MTDLEKSGAQEIAVTRNPEVDRELTAREKRWAEEYVQHFNAARAARDALGCAQKYSRQRGYAMKKDPAVAAYVEKLIAELRQRSGLNANAVYMQLAKIATADMTDFASWDNNGVKLVKSADLPAGAGQVVKEVVMTKEGPKLKLEDRLPALVRLGQENGMFVKKVDARLGRLPEQELSDAELLRIAEGDED